MEINEKILDQLGWIVECESPLEISHIDGSTATGWAAEIVIQELHENFEDYLE